MTINGSAERKSANHRPELAREITTLKAAAVMAVLVSGGRLRFVGNHRRVTPTLNVMQAASTNRSN